MIGMMDLHFNTELAKGYHSGSQISRVLTEDWVERNMFCPVCGAPMLGHYEANKPVADFFCDDCRSDFELKSKESKTATVGHKIADGAYGTMIERITSRRNPHLFVMTYTDWSVNNLLLIPNYFFVPGIIEKRKPLADTARRAGWTGCNIEIGNIPDSGKIFIIRNSRLEDKSKVVDLYQRTQSLREENIENRGWLLDVLRCVERIPKDDFVTDDVYAFADELQGKHPTQKPLALLTRIILASTEPNAWVLDPFAGSSTTGIAANLLGRRYLGIEREEEFALMGKRRREEIERIENYASYRRNLRDIMKAEDTQTDIFNCREPEPFTELPFYSTSDVKKIQRKSKKEKNALLR